MKFSVRVKKKGEGETVLLREAKDRFEVARTLRAEGYSVLSAEPVELSARGSGSYTLASYFPVSVREKIVFAHTLGAMLKAGLPLARALSVAERQAVHAGFKKAVGQVAMAIGSGESLRTALTAHPRYFPRVFTAMVAVGEESGTLPESLEIVSEQMAKSYALRKKIRGALMYPAIVLIAMIGIGIFMLISVVPSMVASFAELGADLPTTTQFVIRLSDSLVSSPVTSLLLAIFVAVSFVWFLRTEWGRRGIQRFSLKIPGISVLVQQSNVGVMARTLASLVSAGVDMVEALSITADVVPNFLYAESLTRARDDVQKGVTLSSVFRADVKLYPVLVPAMAEVGEETGKFSDMLLNMAVFYEDEVDSATKNLSTIVEPVLMITIGIAVGFFALAMIEPLYSITEHIK